MHVPGVKRNVKDSNCTTCSENSSVWEYTLLTYVRGWLLDNSSKRNLKFKRWLQLPCFFSNNSEEIK